MNLSSIALTFLLSSFSTAEATLKGSHAGSGFEEARQLKEDADVCGPERGTTCVSTLNARSSHALVDCLKEKFPAAMDTNVTIVEWFNGASRISPFKLTFPFPQENYADFKLANYNAGQGYPRFPAGIFYAESEDEVIKAVICAREAGYKVSPRGRGHSYQGLSSMDGYLVIDMSLMCVPDEFVVTPLDDEPWLLGQGQKAIASIKAGAGCTNAVMLAFTAQEFPDGIYLIGSCPTVGITGYATGGGQGDTTPWVGLGIDDVLSYDIVLYDGTFVTANATSHSDLYWALRGGGSGFGVITSLETAVIGAPEESSGGFTVFHFQYKQTQDEAREFLKRFQDFLVPDLPFGSKKYKEKIRSTSAKYGGSAGYNTNVAGGLFFNGMFLGSSDEANATFTEAGLLDPEIFNASASVALEFSSYGEAQLFIVCKTLTSDPWYWPTWTNPGYDRIKNVADVCELLGIDSTKYCHDVDAFSGYPPASGWNMRIPNCNPFNKTQFDLDDVKDVILPAMQAVAIKPQSWFNRPGALAIYGFTAGKIKDVATLSWVGGLLIGRLDPDILLELANEGVSVYHFAHGAPTLKARDETGYYNREEFTLLNLGTTEKYENITSILINKAYDGDASKLKGFYNYLNPEGNRDWRNYYFGDNYERLSVIKAMYDVTNGFGNPLQVEPAPLSSKAGKETLFD